MIGGDLGSATLPILDRRVEHGFYALGERGRVALRTSFRVAGSAMAKASAQGRLAVTGLVTSHRRSLEGIWRPHACNRFRRIGLLSTCRSDCWRTPDISRAPAKLGDCL